MPSDAMMTPLCSGSSLEGVDSRKSNLPPLWMEGGYAMSHASLLSLICSCACGGWMWVDVGWMWVDVGGWGV